ncbi:MFS multidrug transporter [Marssonina coronariae]|uniref:MFS multidrug transporter n=1 Tax=Diplocarpon coronariae TaxID=2795749 RepID=A0A218ZED3_9HELO|nr:MFS multidrug transporter [Marssonina coronariae]
MADSEEAPTWSRKNPSGASSRRSGASRTSLHRMPSAGAYLDDQTQYYGQDNHEKAEEVLEDDRSSGDSDLTEKDPETKVERDTDIVPEVRHGLGNQRDVEAGPRLETSKSTRSVRSARSARDPNLVSWDGPDDKRNPKNWSYRRKWAATLIVSSFTFISPVSSTMIAPAVNAISAEFNIINEVEKNLTLSVFVLAYAVGPLICGPLSEMYGRVIVLQLGNLLYLFFNLGCGLARTKEQLVAFRFLSGLGGSAPLAIGGGVLSDLFTAEERGKAISVYSLAPLLGPAIGPVAGGFITQNTTWRWVFYATTIADGLIQLMGFFFLQETYPPVLLDRKKKAMMRETGNEALHTEFDSPDRQIGKTLRVSLLRPFKLLFTQIIVQVLALYMAYLYGIMYLVMSTFPGLWEDEYHESVGIGGLNYISLGVGFFVGTQVAAPCQDRIYKALKKRNNGIGKPEFRVPLMIPGALLVPIGLFWYGWSAQAHMHWIMPNIGAAIFSAGTIVGFQCIQTYTVDAYTRYAASAIGAATVLRSLAGFGMPLFAPYMYAALDFGWGNSLLAFVGIALGWPAPILLWKYAAAPDPRALAHLETRVKAAGCVETSPRWDCHGARFGYFATSRQQRKQQHVASSTREPARHGSRGLADGDVAPVHRLPVRLRAVPISARLRWRREDVRRKVLRVPAHVSTSGPSLLSTASSSPQTELAVVCAKRSRDVFDQR